jgi:signal transduction histidine kinase/CheY-like chemotaxis protein
MKLPLLTLILLFSFTAFNQTIILNNNFKEPNICQQSAIYEDKTGKLTLSEIQTKKFIKYSNKTFVFPFSDSHFWVKFKLTNQLSNQKWAFVWENAMVENLYFFIPQADGTYKEIKEGCMVYKPQNKFVENIVILPFATFNNKEQTFYVKIQSKRGHQTAFELYSESGLNDYKLNRYKREFFFNGFMVLRLFYVLMLVFFIIKDTTFQRYSIFIILRTLAYWGLVGVLGNLFTSDPTIAKHINQQPYCLMPIGYVIAINAFLELKRFPKFVQHFPKTIIIITLILSFCIVFDYQSYWLRASTMLSVFTIFFCVILYIISIIRKHKIDWAYSMPFLLGVTSTLYISLRRLGMPDFPGSNEISYSIFMGEILVFGLFLGRIIRNYEKNKEKSIDELAFNRAQALRLKDLDLAKNNLFTNISHEFRTPLTLILGPMEELQRKNPENEVFKIIHRNANRLLELINQLLDISKLESGQLQPEIRKIALPSFFKRLSSSFNSLAESKGIVFSIQQNYDEIEGFIDTDKTEKIVNNLLANAIKFTENGKKVTFSIEYHNVSIEKKQYLLMKVEDEGLGIPENKLEKIFDRFYQIDGNTNRKFEGSGIGLSLVKELVNVLKGTITVKSKENIGTSFWVEIPIDVETWKNNIIITEPIAKNNGIENSVLMDSSHNDVVKDNTSENILLIVDDNEDIRSYVSSIFESDYKIIEAMNGKDGLLKAKEHIPDLIISDLMMPEMDGFEFCKQIKSDQKTSHIPIIMLTAKANIESRIEGLELGADDYLIKPFNSNEIKARVRNMILIREKIKNYFTQKVIDLKPNEIKVSSSDEIFIRKIKQVVENNIANSQFNVEQFSNEMDMSMVQLRRKIKALTSQTIVEFIRMYRLERAAQLLAQHAGNVSEIAFNVGFDSLSYFSKVFQESYGVSPSEFRDNPIL